MQKHLDKQLWESSNRGDVNGVVSILERGANVNNFECWPDGSPLHAAAKSGHVECIKALLDRGAGVDTCASTFYCSTPLHGAASEGHVECIKALLHHGADVNITDLFSHTPLYAAASKGHVECVKALLGRGADVNIKTSRGCSALDEALCNGCHDIVDAIHNHMSRRTHAQQYGDQLPASQSSSRNLQTEKRELSTLLAAARSRNDEHKVQLAAARSRIDEHEAELALARSRNGEYAEQLATARSRIDQCEVQLACMTSQGDVLPSQDVDTLELLLANVDMECLRKAILDKRVQRELRQALDAAAECGVGSDGNGSRGDQGNQGGT
eukprot:gene22307-biopygen30989